MDQLLVVTKGAAVVSLEIPKQIVIDVTATIAMRTTTVNAVADFTDLQISVIRSCCGYCSN